MTAQAPWVIQTPSEFPDWFIFTELDKVWPHTETITDLARALAIRDVTEIIAARWGRR